MSIAGHGQHLWRGNFTHTQVYNFFFLRGEGGFKEKYADGSQSMLCKFKRVHFYHALA